MELEHRRMYGSWIGHGKASAADWIPTRERMPLANERVRWISPGGCVEVGTFLGGWLWLPQGSTMPMYVYYTPVFWQPIIPPTPAPAS